MEVLPYDVIMYKKGDYPKSGLYEIISLEDVLYIGGRKCANPECDKIVGVKEKNNIKYCPECYKQIFNK